MDNVIGIGKDKLFFSENHRLKDEISSFFDIDILLLQGEQKEIFNVFIDWMLKSIVWDENSASWKYKNMGKKEKGSFTFGTNFMTFAHMEYNKDPKDSWPHFDFEAYEKGLLKMINGLHIEYVDNSMERRMNIHEGLLRVREIMFSGNFAERFDEIEKITEEVKPHIGYYSNALDLLKKLGLFYGQDSEGCCQIPIEYTKI